VEVEQKERETIYTCIYIFGNLVEHYYYCYQVYQSNHDYHQHHLGLFFTVTIDVLVSSVLPTLLYCMCTQPSLPLSSILFIPCFQLLSEFLNYKMQTVRYYYSNPNGKSTHSTQISLFKSLLYASHCSHTLCHNEQLSIS